MKSVRFLLQFAWVNLGALIGFALVVTAGCYLTGVPAGLPEGSGNLFQTYFSCFPLMTLLIIFLYTFALCTSNLNLALSMGARRRDFFWAIQGIILLYTAVGWVLQLMMSSLPWLGNWSQPDRWTVMMCFGGRLWLFPLLCAMLGILGCVAGVVFTRSKVWGTICIMLAMLAAVFGVVVILFLGDADMWQFLTHGEWAGFWTVLPPALLGVTAAAALASEWVIWRAVHRFVVR